MAPGVSKPLEKIPCCGKLWFRNALYQHTHNTLTCEDFKGPICSSCKAKVASNKREEHAFKCALRRVCNDKPLDDAIGRVRVVNIHYKYLLEKLRMANPYESRQRLQANIKEGDWLLFSATAGSVDEAIGELARSDHSARALLAKDRGRIMGFGRVTGFASNQGGEWPFHILFKRIYPIAANVTYTGTNSILDNFFSVTPYPELVKEMTEIMHAYARAELEANPITWL